MIIIFYYYYYYYFYLPQQANKTNKIHVVQSARPVNEKAIKELIKIKYPCYYY